MLLRQLEYLAALARERHFARAADSCHVSQPSLSAAISKLERELGVPIVRRGRRFAGLTPEGERVLQWAHRILADCDALRHEVSMLRGNLSGTLRFGAIPTALTAAPPLTAPFCSRYPNTRISLEFLSSREIARRLADFEIDLAMTYVDDDELDNVRVTPLYHERYLLLAPDDCEFANRATVRWAEVARLPLCLLTRQMRNRRILDEIFADAGVTTAPAIETDTVSALYAHVATRQWSSVIAHAWLYMFPTPRGMRIVPLEHPARTPLIKLVVADRDPEPLLARALVDLARDLDLRSTLDRLVQVHLTSTHPR